MGEKEHERMGLMERDLPNIVTNNKITEIAEKEQVWRAEVNVITTKIESK